MSEQRSGAAPSPAGGWLYWVTKAVLTPLMLAYFRPQVRGRRHVPRHGAAIIACNHVSYLDWLALPLVVAFRRIVFLAKSEYFERPGLRGRLQRFFFTATGQIPVDRGGGDAGLAALRTAERLLHDGALLGVFPEGTRSRDGRLQRGRTGVARVAARTGAPVIPCATIGLFEAAPPGRRLPRRVRFMVRFGAPVCWPAGQRPDAAALRAFTDDLMSRIARLARH